MFIHTDGNLYCRHCIPSTSICIKCKRFKPFKPKK